MFLLQPSTPKSKFELLSARPQPPRCVFGSGTQSFQSQDFRLFCSAHVAHLNGCAKGQEKERDSGWIGNVRCQLVWGYTFVSRCVKFSWFFDGFTITLILNFPFLQGETLFRYSSAVLTSLPVRWLEKMSLEIQVAPRLHMRRSCWLPFQQRLETTVIWVWVKTLYPW